VLNRHRRTIILLAADLSCVNNSNKKKVGRPFRRDAVAIQTAQLSGEQTPEIRHSALTHTSISFMNRLQKHKMTPSTVKLSDEQT
jgi:hypothetical protein